MPAFHLLTTIHATLCHMTATCLTPPLGGFLIPALVYLRISDDQEGLALGVKRQDKDCHILAATLGARIVKRYWDNDAGASTRSKKPRKYYKAMLEHVRSGRDGIKLILSYSNSRLTRRPLELEELIKLHENTGVEIHTVVSGKDNLSTADGRMVARIKAAVDAAEAERTGERVARKHVEIQEKGLPGGGPRPFGFTEDRITHDPKEAQAIREAVAILLEGGTLATVSRLWNRQGIATTKGNGWLPSTVRLTLRNPRLCGMRARWVKRNKDKPDSLPTGWYPVLVDGVPKKAVWEPIISVDEFNALQDTLAGRKRSSGNREGASRYLLSGILRCGACGGPMFTSNANGKRGNTSYSCRPVAQGGCGKVARVAYRVDDIVKEATLTALRAELEGSQVEPEPFSGAAEVARLETLLADLTAAWRAGQIPSAAYFAERADLDAEIAQLKKAERSHTRSLAERAEALDVVKRWEASSIQEKRLAVREAFSAIVVEPLPIVDGRKVKAWNPALITFHPH